MIIKNVDDVTIVFKCETCRQTAEVPMTFWTDAGVPICGNEDCANEGDDMVIAFASVEVSE